MIAIEWPHVWPHLRLLSCGDLVSVGSGRAVFATTAGRRAMFGVTGPFGGVNIYVSSLPEDPPGNTILMDVGRLHALISGEPDMMTIATLVQLGREPAGKHRPLSRELTPLWVQTMDGLGPYKSEPWDWDAHKTS